MAITIGQKLGSFDVLSIVGRGGMGEVYRARDTRLKREVAIKILPEQFARDPERVGRFSGKPRSLLPSITRSRKGQELFYLDENDKLMAVQVQTSGQNFIASNPIKLFDTRIFTTATQGRTYDVSADGQRFLIIKDNA